MTVFLRIIGILALLGAGLGALEITLTWQPGATVFQQIAARVSLGLSLMVMVCAFGFASLIDRAEQTAAPVGPATQIGSDGLNIAPAPGARPNGNPIGKVDGINLYRDGDRVLAIVDGQPVHASTVGDMSRFIESRRA